MVNSCSISLIFACLSACLLAEWSLAEPGRPVEDVQVQFYMLQLEQWTKQGLEAKFKWSLALGLTNFCSTNFTACGANSSDGLNFTSSSVHIPPGYAVNVDSHYMKLRLYISYNLPGESDVFNFTAADTTTILENSRLHLYEQIGHYIVYINEKFYSIPPPYMTNLIVVSASGGFTLLLIIFALIMRTYYADDPKKLLESKREANRRRQSREAERRNGRHSTAAAPLAAAADGANGANGGAPPAAGANGIGGERNPGFSDFQEVEEPPLSGDSASPVLSPTNDEAPPEAATAECMNGGRRRRLGAEAAEPEQIPLSEAKNGSLHGNGGCQ